MIRKFIIGQLTMMSTWFGIIVILAACFLPRDYVIILGIVLLLTDDTHLQKIFNKLRAWLMEVWTE